MSKHPVWSEEAVAAEAEKYQRKVDFKCGNNGAYQAACRKFPQLLEKLFPHRPSKYTEQMLRSICSNYASIKDLELGHRGASEALRLHFPKSLRDELFKRRIKPANHWTLPRLLAAAAMYKTKEDFYRGNLGAYSSAVRQGVLNDLNFEHGGNSDYDVVYIWRAKDQFFNGDPLYKIGVTSARLGVCRIRRVARAARFTPVLIGYSPQPEDANQTESLILRIGADPLFEGFEGCTEFRAMSDEMLWAAMGALRTPKSVTVRPGSPWPVRFT